MIPVIVVSTFHNPHNLALDASEIESMEDMSESVIVTLKSGRKHRLNMTLEQLLTALNRMNSPLLRQ